MIVAEEREAVVDGEGSDWVLGVDDDVLALHVLVVECVGEWVGKAVVLVVGCHGFFRLGRGQSSGLGGSDACQFLVRQSSSCVQYCSWRAS